MTKTNATHRLGPPLEVTIPPRSLNRRSIHHLDVALTTCLALSFLILAGCSEPGELATVTERGKLVMISFPHQESFFVRVDTSKGPMPPQGPADHFQGLDVELMQRFAASLGVELEIRPVREPSYRALIPDLLAGEGDLVASSFSITPERQKLVSFSRPYYTTYRVIIARPGVEIESSDDLEPYRAVAVPGSSHYRTLVELSYGQQKILARDFTLDLYNALADDEADFALVDHDSVLQLGNDFPEIRIVYRYPGDDHFGVAVRHGSDLLPRLDAFFDQLEASGELEEIVRRHYDLVGK